MATLMVTGDFEIRQFTVEIDGMYAWRSTLHTTAQKDSNWTIGRLVKGDKISGQHEGCGPIEFKTVD